MQDPRGFILDTFLASVDYAQPCLSAKSDEPDILKGDGAISITDLCPLPLGSATCIPTDQDLERRTESRPEGTLEKRVFRANGEVGRTSARIREMPLHQWLVGERFFGALGMRGGEVNNDSR